MGKTIRSAKPDAENPEWSSEDFANAQPLNAFPELAQIIRQGRPALPAEARKQRVTMYLDREIVERLKADGRGWQTRANAVLRKALGV